MSRQPESPHTPLWFIDWFRFGGFQVRVTLEPSDQLIGGRHRLRCSRRPPRLVDSLHLPEVEECDLSNLDFPKEQVVGMLRIVERPRGAFEPPVVSGDAQRK